jgi:hypothetical protein
VTAAGGRSADAEDTAEPEPPASASPPPGDAPKGNDLLRWLLGVVANATVLTALLVFFGWQRNDVQSQRLGIDESVLGMSTRDYVLRSTGSVLALLLVIGVGGLLWLWCDDRLVARIRARGRQDRLVRYTLRLLPFGWLILPAFVWVLGYVWRTTAFVAWPFSIGAGVLLVLYAAHLRAMLPGAAEPEPGRVPLLRAFAAVIVGVTLFWGASNYATVQGNAFADHFASHVGDLTQVAVYASRRLHLTAPGVTETPIPGDKDAYRYRYTGLRLVLHSGGHYFLISDGWTPRHGVVLMLGDDDPLRLEFLRDRR